MPTSQKIHGDGRLAIIAGRGRLPLDVANSARAHGENPIIFSLEGEAEQDWSKFDQYSFQIGDFAALKKEISRQKVNRIVLAGGVKRRPQVSQIRPTINTLLALPGILKKIVSGGDDNLLRGFISLIEAQGCKVIGVHEVVPNLVAAEGSIGQLTPDKEAQKDIDVAVLAALRLGELDIGQGAVSVGGRIVALEGLEGTDAMLERVTDLRSQGRLPKHKRGVLVKLCKPGQDMRVDLPTIGPDTINAAREAGLAGIVIEAGRSFILEREEVASRADAAGLFVIGMIREQHNG